MLAFLILNRVLKAMLEFCSPMGYYGIPDFARKNKSSENINQQLSPIGSSSNSELNTFWLNGNILIKKKL
ncbi:hypothetical protein NQ317_017321 [Molorchus minor]|uniref:Uncharacterized protein n=1 Tax=Molorchus minor TaxID=1323400 RepID=A0ABQ9K3G1_9CUCU|nr:hypothetical protein NQ317_017321 [Molorchus minor]